ncbi:hypothetical protein [Streptomyces sp. NPDC058953]|uniref:hypothetical protein n=1 Tax=unclassified Streptomyces TaxID=2593676 RepID=UPI0036CA0ADB
MVKRLGLALAAVAASAGLVLSTATPSAATFGWRVHNHYSSKAECDAAGVAGAHMWGVIYQCKPFAYKPGVWELWVRI